MDLFVDRRERLLIEALGEFPHTVCDLPLGDVVCEYEGGPPGWLAERKTACDLARSIGGGRWAEQGSRLRDSGKPVFFLIEGDLRSVENFPPTSLVGALVNAQLRQQTHVIRTACVEETALVITQLAEKMKRPGRAPPPGVQNLRPPQLLGKRQRDADPRSCFVRQLMCVPSISERIASALVDQFGSLPRLQAALGDPGAFPKVPLPGGRTCLGKARLRRLASYLCDQGEPGQAVEEPA